MQPNTTDLPLQVRALLRLDRACHALRYALHRLAAPSLHRDDASRADPYGNERDAYAATFRGIAQRDRRTEKPVAIATIGLRGSGRHRLAKELERELGATIVCADDFKLALRRVGLPESLSRPLVERAALELLAAGRSVILHGDFVHPLSRASLERRLRRAGHGRPQYVRILCDPRVLFCRVQVSAQAPYYETAQSPWQDKATAGIGVKQSHIAYDIADHYLRHEGDEGPTWVPRILPVRLAHTVDTTEPDVWRGIARDLAAAILAASRATRVEPVPAAPPVAETA